MDTAAAKKGWPVLAVLAFQQVVTERDAALEALEEAEAGADEAVVYWEQRDEALNERDAALEALEEAEGKLRAAEQLMYEIPDYVLRCRLDRILRGTKEGE